MNTGKPENGTMKSALDRLEEFLELDPANPLLLAETADAALAGGAFQRAQQLINDGLKLPGDPSAWHFRQANLYIAQRHLDEARHVLATLEQAGGKHPAIAHNLGYIQLLKEDFEACRETLQPWIDTGAANDDSALQILWLRVMHRLDRMEEAWDWVKQWRAAQVLSPGAAGVASLIALDLGDFDAALALSQQALHDAGPQLEALVARASVSLARQDAASARHSLDAALKLNPDDGRTLSTMGFVAMLEHRVGEARQRFNKALSFVPGHIETWHGLGWACVLQQDWVAAQAAFESALRLDPEFAESHGALAVVHALQGHTQYARDHIDRATQLDASNLAARYAQAVLSGQARDLQDLERLTRPHSGKRHRRPR